MRLHAVLDACVLIPMPLAHTLLNLAQADLYRPVWSPLLLEETRRNLVGKLGVPNDRAERRVATMRRAFPLAEVLPPTPLVDAMTVDVKDRHVAAAAVTAGAELIVTYNLRDFPHEALDPYGITAIHPDEFLLDLLDEDPAAVSAAIEQQRTSLRAPAMTVETFHRALAVNAPGFVQELSTLQSPAGADSRPANTAPDPQMPLPIESRTDEEMSEAMLPGGLPEEAVTSFAVMSLWFIAIIYVELPGGQEILRQLSYHPDRWGDYSAVAELVDGFSYAQGRHLDIEQPDNLCYFKLIQTDVGGQMFAAAEIHQPVLWVMLARDDLFHPWRVLGIGAQPWKELEAGGGPSTDSDLPPWQPR